MWSNIYRVLVVAVGYSNNTCLQPQLQSASNSLEVLMQGSVLVLWSRHVTSRHGHYLVTLRSTVHTIHCIPSLADKSTLARLAAACMLEPRAEFCEDSLEAEELIIKRRHEDDAFNHP